VAQHAMAVGVTNLGTATHVGLRWLRAEQLGTHRPRAALEAFEPAAASTLHGLGG